MVDSTVKAGFKKMKQGKQIVSLEVEESKEWVSGPKRSPGRSAKFWFHS